MSLGGEKIKEGLTNLGAGFSHADGDKFEKQSLDFTRCTAGSDVSGGRKKARQSNTGGLALIQSACISDDAPVGRFAYQSFDVR